MDTYNRQYLFVGGSQHGEIRRMSLPDGYSVRIPIYPDIRHQIKIWEKSDPISDYGMSEERYETCRLRHLSSAGLKIDFSVLVLSGTKRYVADGDTLHQGYAKWALDMLLYDSGLTPVRPPKYPL